MRVGLKSNKDGKIRRNENPRKYIKIEIR